MIATTTRINLRLKTSRFNFRTFSDKEKAKQATKRKTKYRDYSKAPKWFHGPQLISWDKEQAIVAICAGWQSGKTVTLPHWLKREIQRRGPGDYGAFSSTYKLLARKFLPELKKVFNDVAVFRAGDQQFVFTEKGSWKIHGPDWNGEPTIIQLGHAENPDSLESATLKAVVWDECGQRLVPKQSYHTVRSRLMVNRGRMCLASKPYESGWFEELVTKGEKDESEEGSVGVVSYPSWANPENPPKDDPYWEEILSEMPTWRFVMQYEGRFTMPAGLIYDCFNKNVNVVPDFNVTLAGECTMHPGMDFGKVNTAGVVAADDHTSGIIYIIGEYHIGQKKDYPEYIAAMRALTSPYGGGYPLLTGCGGNKHGEDGWREAYRMHGLSLDEPPEGNVEVQIQDVYSLLKRGLLKLFENGAAETIADIEHFSRVVDEDGNVTDKILDESKWHRLAALRYIVAKLRPNYSAAHTSTPTARQAPGLAPDQPVNSTVVETDDGDFVPLPGSMQHRRR